VRVPAHAPRLHGRKVWKKNGAPSTKAAEEDDAPLQELLSEGSGARKKMRVTGAPQNISNATWKESGLYGKHILTELDARVLITASRSRECQTSTFKESKKESACCIIKTGFHARATLRASKAHKQQSDYHTQEGVTTDHD
jgi:hypothetical protein